MTASTPRPRRDWRIAIVGAGAAGLSCAHALRREGYRSVTVFEAAERVGGKCCTLTWERRTYELGAGALTRAYDNVRELMQEHGISAKAGIGGAFLQTGGRDTYLPPPLRSFGFLRVASDAARLFRTLAKHPPVGAPGFESVDASLSAPFAEWARANGCEAAAAMIEPWFTGFGYGYFDEIPAAYVLKYAALFRFPVYELLDTGYQGLWESVAAGLDVRLDTPVARVRRDDDRVVFRTPAGDQAFDALVLACPLDRALAFLDASAAERALFGSIQLIDYHVVGVRMRGAPKARYGFLAEHLRRENAGKPSFYYRRWLDRDLVLFYMLPPPGTSLEASVAATERVVSDLGGATEEVVIRHAWRYFPHVDAPTMAGGFYSRLEALQGQQRTWIVGEICSFSAVEPVVAYSRAMVARWFR